MRGDSILIFGGGDNQLTLINASKERGYFTVVIDPGENAPGKFHADAFEIISPKDYEATCKVIEKYNVKGIATAQMENPLLLMAQVAEKYSFIFPSVEQIKRARNKFLMKQAFITNYVPCAKGKLFTKEQNIPEKDLEDYEFPLIIKPADAFSSRGVLKVNSFNEIKQNENFSRSFSSDNSTLVEEFLEGKEYSIESLTYSGKTHVIQYTEKIITNYPYTVEMGHIQPAELSEKQKAGINKIVEKAIKSLELDNCATHTELKLTESGPKIIEIGARLGGDYISSYLTLHSTGINMDAAVVDIAMGNKPKLKKKLNRYSGIFYFHLGEGKKVVRIEDWKEILNCKNVVHANLLIKSGEIIPALTDSAKRSGYVILESETKESLLNSSHELKKSISSKIIYER
ncbi:MAG TPA: ATP-grasp domain-containing protein [Ignavibacteriaceae bacterium]|nr:ATP-grasp domain-containing protein [Ignavibacteriaceae bacterium]